MDFIVGLPRSSKGMDSIWVIVDRLTKSAYFLPVKTIYNVDKLAILYIDDIVRLHRVPVSIVLIGTRSLHRDSGKAYRQHWVLN